MALATFITGLATKAASNHASSLPVTGAGTLSTQVQIFGFSADAIGSAAYAAAHNVSPYAALAAVGIGIALAPFVLPAAVSSAAASVAALVTPLLGGVITEVALSSILAGVFQVGIAGAIGMAVEPALNEIMQDAGSLYPNVDEIHTGSVPIPVEKPLAPYISNLVTAQNAAQDVQVRRSDPLIFDLDGDGVELLSVANGVYWDLDEDDFAEQAGWVAPDDGLLAFDANGDGVIDTQDELFGNDVEDGFTQLAAFDTDLNGVINANDADFANLLIWQDANSDGVSQSAELLSLSAWGITEISLTSMATNYELQGHIISHEGTFTMNGQSHEVLEAWFALDNTNTRYIGDVTLDIRTAFLPTMRGYGDLPDLHIAMSMNETLLLAVQDVATKDFNALFDSGYDLQNAIEQIMYQWAGVENVSPHSRGGAVDARQLEFVEALTGIPYTQDGSSNPQGVGALQMNEAFKTVYNHFAVNVLMQTGGQDIFVNVGEYDFISDNYTESYTLDFTAIQNSFNALNLSGNDLHDAWDLTLRSIDKVIGFTNITPADQLTLDTIIQNSDTTNTLDLALFLDSFSQIVFGSSIADTITGSSQKDRIWGMAGDDIIYGEGGDDSLEGWGGNDTLYGGLGNDVLNGSTGDDSYHWTVGDGNDIFVESGGIDTIYIHGNVTANDVTFSLQTRPWPHTGQYFLIHVGNETLNLGDHISFDHNNNRIIDEMFETIMFDDGSTIDLTVPLLFKGTENNDTFDGTRLAEEYHGFAGDDSINMYEGDDIVHAGLGSDTVRAGVGNDTIYGEGGNDNLQGDQGDDTFYGGLGDDIMSGGSGDDAYHWAVGDGGDQFYEQSGTDTVYIHGDLTTTDLSLSSVFVSPNIYNLSINIDNETLIVGRQFSFSNNNLQTDKMFESVVLDNGTNLDISIANVFVGNNWGNVLQGNANDNFLFGNEGDDTYVLDQGYDYVSDNSGTSDRVLVGSSYTLSDMSFYRTGGGSNLVITPNFTDAIVIYDQYASSNVVIETLEFSDGSTFDLSTLDLDIHGTAANDTLVGFNSDVLGDDTIYGYAGNDKLYGKGGVDYLYGGDGGDKLYGQNGNDQLFGEEGNDALYGYADDDTIEGGNGDDVLYGGIGADTLRGDAGNDQLVGEDGNDRLYGGAGIDQLYGNDGADELWGGDDADALIGGNGDDLLYGENGDDSIYGDAGNDTIYAGAGLDSVHGFEGDDTIYGGDGADILYGEYRHQNDPLTAGDDTIYGEGGDDYIQGNAGDDTLDGGDGRDIIWGGVGADTITGGAGIDDILGEDGDDVIHGGDGVDDLDGGLGNDTIYGDGDGDSISGRAGDDILYGGAGDDFIYGQDDNDQLFGGDGADYLSGQNGNDTINSGDGYDQIYGGSGSDTFIFESFANYDNTGFDRVFDFSIADSDVIDISEMLTAYDSANDSISDFINVVGNSARSYIQVDADGTGSTHAMTTIVRLDGVNINNPDLQNLINSGTIIV